MLRKLRGTTWLALTAGIAIAAVSCSTSGGGSSSNSPVNIGVAGAYVGGPQQYGIPFADGALAAADDINGAGGILGGKAKIITIDTHGDPVDAVTAIRQAIAVQNIKAEVGLSALDYASALPILLQSHIVTFTHIGNPAIDKLQSPYHFETGPSDALLGSAMIYYAHQKGYNNIALVFDAASGAQALVPPIQADAKILGMNIVATPNLPVGSPSYESEAAQVVSAHPDVILTQLEASSAAPFYAELRQLGGGNIPVIGSDLTLETDWLTAVGPDYYAKNVVSLESTNDTSSPSYSLFLSTYLAHFGTQPQYLSAYIWDGVTTAALAMVDAHSTDSTVYSKDILDVTTPGNDKTNVYDFAQGVQLLNQGKKIKYVGVGSPMIFNQYGRVTTGFAIVQNTPSGKLTTLGSIPATALVNLNV